MCKRQASASLAFFAVLSLALVLAACGGSNSSQKTESTSNESAAVPAVKVSSEIPMAPAFSDKELAAYPSTNWISPSGGTTGDRYTDLSQINASNASQLKANWLTTLRGSGASGKYSQEATPVVYDGVIYISTGNDDIFAVAASTGKILWENTGNQDPALAAVICCGWDNRGVALGDGHVFAALLNDEIEALDQKTGQTDWKVKLPGATSGAGYTVTMAPLYAHGMLFVGPSGAEYGVRGRMYGLDANTGKLIWTHYNIPGPGEAGHASWPADNNEWELGGAATWNTPTLDPELGLIYYSTANAGNDVNGSNRAGDNLYSSSILALHMKTGKMAWYYQQVHHDIWDYDSTSPTVLIDGEADGKMVKGIAEPSKTGYVYFLNREDGKPIYPIPEKPVEQNVADKTAKKQPIPTMPPFSPQVVSKKHVEELQEGIDSGLPKGFKRPKVIAGSTFTPWRVETSPVITSSTNDGWGGANWGPSTFDPANDYYYVCGQSSGQASTIPVHRAAFVKGKEYWGGGQVEAWLSDNSPPGSLTAYDMKTGKIAWKKIYPKEGGCYGGASSTAGNVVFAGRNNGEMTAYNATTGKELWAFQTGAGANAPAAFFEINGEERMVELAGGNADAGTAHGDNLWEWSLKGTIGPVQPGAAARNKGEATLAEQQATTKTVEEGQPQAGEGENAGLIAAGKTLFAENCASCHGALGEGGEGGPNLNTMHRAKSVSGVVAQLTKPVGAMPSFDARLSAQEKEEIAEFVTHDITHSTN